MTVKELIEELQKVNQDLEVIISKDAEGNGFSPLDENYSIGYYSPENGWRGDFYSKEEVQEDILPDEKITLQEFIKETKSKECISFFPLN